MSGLPVLMYHSIGGPMPSRLQGLSVPPSLLAEHLSALVGAGFGLLGLTEALTSPTPGPVVALTFDDAYVDFLEHAVPALVAHGARATLYAPTRDLGGSASWLRDGAGLRLLAASDLAGLDPDRVEVGSHGAEHVPMDVLPPGVAAAHLRESRSLLEDLTGRRVASFCYPHGYQSAALRREVARAGYTNACTIGHRSSQPGEDRLAVSRLAVGPDLDGDGLLALLRRGRPASALPGLKRAATPAWRVARRGARRVLGATWT